MEEQQQIVKQLVDFSKWLITNVKKLGLENLNSVQTLAQAQTPEDLEGGLNDLAQELGEEKFGTLVNAWKQSKQKSSKFKKGGRMNYLVNKFKGGGDTLVIHTRYPIIKGDPEFITGYPEHVGWRDEYKQSWPHLYQRYNTPTGNNWATTHIREVIGPDTTWYTIPKAVYSPTGERLFGVYSEEGVVSTPEYIKRRINKARHEDVLDTERIEWISK